MRGLAHGVAAVLMLAAVPLFAQTPAPAVGGQAQPPAPAKPAAPAAQTAPAKPAPPPAPAPAPAPRPFPEGSKFAFVVLQRIANESAEGKTAAAKIQALQAKKAGELTEKNKQLQTLQQKLEKEGSVMSVAAQADVQKQIERIQVDIQRFTQDAQQEIQDLQNQLQQQFQVRIEPVLAQVGQEKGLHFIFNGPDSGLVWADPSLDISTDVIQKLDAAAATPAPTAKPPVK